MDSYGDCGSYTSDSSFRCMCVCTSVSLHMCACMCCVVDQVYLPSCLLCICTHCVVHGPASQGRFSCLFQWHTSRGNQVAWVPAPGASHPSWKVLGIKTREWSFPDLCNSYFIRWMTLWMWLWSGSAYAVLHIISYLFFLLPSESNNLRELCIRRVLQWFLKH